MHESSGLSPVQRLITTHDANGKAVISSATPETVKMSAVDGGNAFFGLQYCSDQFPANLNEDKDIATYESYLKTPPGLVISTGSILRTVDMAPGLLSPMHRTVSLDYGIVLEGEVELILDGGDKRIMKRGDVAIQRGTVHAWRNVSDTEWARMIYVLLPCHALEVNGEKLGEDLADMKDVRQSS